jgi:predicted porin
MVFYRIKRGLQGSVVVLFFMGSMAWANMDAGLTSHSVIYGRLNISIEESWAGSGAAIQPKSGISSLSAIGASSSLAGTAKDAYMVDNGGRMGLKGRESLFPETSAVFQYEVGTNSKLRETYVGIQNDRFGLLRLGLLTTANYTSWDDSLNDLNADTGTTSDWLWRGAVRVPSSISYATPWIENMKFSLQYAKNGSQDMTMLAFQTDVKHGKALLGMGISRGHFGQKSVTDYTEWTINGSYDTGTLHWGALLESFHDETPGRELSAIRYIKNSIKVPVLQGYVVLNMGYALLKGASTQGDAGHSYQYQIGYIYPLSTRIKLYLFMQTLNTDTSIFYNTLNTLAVGLRMDF